MNINSLLTLLNSGRLSRGSKDALFKLLTKYKFMNKDLNLNCVNNLFTQFGLNCVNSVGFSDFFIDNNQALMMVYTDSGVFIVFMNLDGFFNVFSYKVMDVIASVIDQQTGELLVENIADTKVLNFFNSKILARIRFNM